MRIICRLELLSIGNIEIDWKQKEYIGNISYIGNKERTLETSKICWKQKKYIGNIVARKRVFEIGNIKCRLET